MIPKRLRPRTLDEVVATLKKSVDKACVEMERLAASRQELLEERQRHLEIVLAAKIFLDEQTDENAAMLRAALEGK
jgi:hypothetical protein